MYIHLGQDTLVKKSDIIGIFDMDNTTVSKRTRDFLSKAEKKGMVVNVSYELPKSFVVCKNKNEDFIIYISQLSSATLLKRCESKIEII